MASNVTIDQAIVNKVNEIKSVPYAKYIVAEESLDRVHSYRIVRQQVSSGKNSVIYKCQSKFGDIFCIIKAYKMGKDKIKSTLKEETCQIMRFVAGKCPQLISTVDIFYTNEKLYLMCDWSARGRLLEVMKQKALNAKLNEQLLNQWSQDILQAVNFLHSNGICHRNIAPGCLLLTAENHVKIGTLSDAVIYVKPADGSLIKQKWLKFSRALNWNQGPEVAKGKLYDPRRADIWSIGATIFWFITRTHPIDYKVNGKMTKQLEHRLGYMRKVSPKCISFVKKMLTYQPGSRPTIQEALQHEWITSGATPTTTEASPSGRDQLAELQMTEIKDTGETAGPEETSPIMGGAIPGAGQTELEASFGQPAQQAPNADEDQADPSV